MKCVTSLKDLVESYEFRYLDSYDFSAGHHCQSFISRFAAYRIAKLGLDMHVCFNPATNLYTVVDDADFKEFKRCSSYVNRCFKYLERIGIL